MADRAIKLVKDDRTKLNRILNDFKLLRGSYVKIGYIEGDKSHKSKKKGKKSAAYINMAALAAVHEYGSPKMGIPERSFIRSWVDGNQPEIRKRMERMVKAIIEGRVSPEIALKTMAVFAQGGIKRQIKTISSPPLKARTIKLKKSSQPLIDTGQLRASVRFIIQKNGFFGKIIGKLR